MQSFGGNKRGVNILSSHENIELDEDKLLLELYKELGLEVRQRSSETYATNRLMLPPLVIGLLVLYGEVETFLGVSFNNPEAIHQLVWFGCVVISLLWICNMSRLAQLSHWHLATQRQCERKLKLRGHRKITKIDEKSLISKALRHSVLRFVGFGIYFFLLLHYILQSIDFIAVPPLFPYSDEALLLLFAILGGAGISYSIWCLYLKDSPPYVKILPQKKIHSKNQN